MKNRPSYAVNSVDHALRLALLLQQEGPLRGSELAERMGIARSTAHRLLSMLVYRGFAQQNEDKRYAAGPAMRSIDVTATNIAELRAVSLAPMQELRNRTGETINLQVLSGSQTRFVATAESHHLLKVGDREGRLLPAWQVSGGKALLAELTPEEVGDRLLADSDFPAESLPSVRRALTTIRRRGYAMNNGVTEPGMVAIARVVRDLDGRAVAAVSLAMPSSRYRPEDLSCLNGELVRTNTEITRRLGTLHPELGEAGSGEREVEL